MNGCGRFFIVVRSILVIENLERYWHSVNTYISTSKRWHWEPHWRWASPLDLASPSRRGWIGLATLKTWGSSDLTVKYIIWHGRRRDSEVHCMSQLRDKQQKVLSPQRLAVGRTFFFVVIPQIWIQLSASIFQGRRKGCWFGRGASWRCVWGEEGAGMKLGGSYVNLSNPAVFFSVTPPTLIM